MTAEAVLATAISTETTRATNAEGLLRDQIGLETRARMADVAMLTDQYKSATATAVALSGMGFIPGKRLNLTMNVGSFEGKSAVAMQGAFFINDNAYINAGIAGGTGGGTAMRTGITFGW